MILPNLDIEKSLWQKGHNYICGIDEVGRGSWAGPLVVGGVILPKSYLIPKGLNDSKKVGPNLRARLERIIKKNALATTTIEISSFQIDKVGLGKATQIAFREVTKIINPKPDFLIIDAFYIKKIAKSKQLAIKKGDTISASIAAASIIAKVYRDNLMTSLGSIYPQYGFPKHKGYGTKAHQEAVKIYGLSKIHRKSYNLKAFAK